MRVIGIGEVFIVGGQFGGSAILIITCTLVMKNFMLALTSEKLVLNY